MTTMKQLPSYQSITDTLDCAKMPALPAELHGYLCGVICGDAQPDSDLGKKVVLNLLEEEGLVTDENYSLLEAVMEVTNQQLQAIDCPFELLLPKDSELLTLRIESLAKWCQSFLSGLGTGGLNQGDMQNTEIAEALQDIAEIAKITYLDKRVDEESEVSYTELVEFIRVAVLLIYIERMNANRKRSETIH